MAGNPKRRAKRQAELAAELKADAEGTPEYETTNWDIEAAKQLGYRNTVKPDGTPDIRIYHQDPPSVIMPSRDQAMRNDRVSLDLWWAEQQHKVEEEHMARMAAIEAAGPHPNGVCAAIVRKFAAIGTAVDVIADLVDLGEGALMQHYARDVRIAVALFNAAIAANMYRIGNSSNDRVAVKAATEIMNRRGGELWKPPAQKVEFDDVSKKGGKSIIDSSKLTPVQREQLQAIVEEQLGLREPQAALTVGLAPGDRGEIIEADEQDLDGN